MQGTVPTPVTSSDLLTIIHRFRLPIGDVSMQPWLGGGSCVYPLGSEFVVKVPHAGAGGPASLVVEAVAARAAHAAGVRTPQLVALDESLRILPVPYLVYERVDGEPLSKVPAEVDAQLVWREVGADLALLHGRVKANESLDVIPSFPQTAETDPRPWVDDVSRLGGFLPEQARWLSGVLERLAPAVESVGCVAFCHGDVNAANVMVGVREPAGYAGLLDWGGAGWADPAIDFAAMPLARAPIAVAGYRAVTPFTDDLTAEARILWFWLRLALFGMRRPDVSEEDRAHRAQRLVRGATAYLAETGLG